MADSVSVLVADWVAVSFELSESELPQAEREKNRGITNILRVLGDVTEISWVMISFFGGGW